MTTPEKKLLNAIFDVAWTEEEVKFLEEAIKNVPNVGPIFSDDPYESGRQETIIARRFKERFGHYPYQCKAIHGG